MKTIAKLIGMFSLLSLLAACGGGGNGASFTSGGGGGGGGGTTQTAAHLSLSLSQVSVLSNNSNSTTLSATALDSSNVVIPGATVTFSADAGALSAGSAVTDANGVASVTFKSGTTDPTNRTATITARAAGVANQIIPVLITGSTVTMTGTTTNLIVAGSPNTDTLTITAKNASNVGVNNTPITLSVDRPDLATLSALSNSGKTDVSGIVTATLTAVSAGTVRVTAEGLGFTATRDYTLTGASNAFQITNTKPAAMATGGSLTVTVSAPGVSNVTFATSLGKLDGAGQLVTKAVVAGIATVVLTSTDAGTATVQAFDAANNSKNDSLAVLISAAAGTATNVTLQAVASSLPRSLGGNTYTTELVATVKNASLQPVNGAPVVFSVSNSTGGGEFVSPVYGLTAADGTIKTTFTSGSLSSAPTGVTVTATVYGTAIVPDPSAFQKIIINQTAGSVVIGYGTVIKDASDSTIYHLPMSVVIADASGAGVPGATVTLSAWPTKFATGKWVPNVIPSSDCQPKTTGVWLNEDINENLHLDSGEDIPYSEAIFGAANPLTTYTEDLNGNGKLDAGEDLNLNGVIDTFKLNGVLDPPNSAAGSLPTSVTTDNNGVATFELVFLKSQAAWIQDRIRATTLVQGTETSGTNVFYLPYSVDDALKCLLPPSPYNP